jgi:hypothetical protein
MSKEDESTTENIHTQGVDESLMASSPGHGSGSGAPGAAEQTEQTTAKEEQPSVEAEGNASATWKAAIRLAKIAASGVGWVAARSSPLLLTLIALLSVTLVASSVAELSFRAKRASELEETIAREDRDALEGDYSGVNYWSTQCPGMDPRKKLALLHSISRY